MHELVKAPIVRVVKLGGSLLELHDLRKRFELWCCTQPPALNLIVVGGGELVEAIRRINQAQALDQTDLHWLCVDLMSATARIAAEILAINHLVDAPDQLSQLMDFNRTAPVDTEPQFVIVAPNAYYRRQGTALPDTRLPQDWTCTSDSIAAWFATQINAAELVLVKSTSLGDSSTEAITTSQLDQLVQCDFVDREFPNVACDISSITLVNLRHPNFGV